MIKPEKKVDYTYYWRIWTVIFMMLSWIVIRFFMRQSILWLIPVYIIYLIINSIIFRSYFLGMIGNFYFYTKRNKKAFLYYDKAIKLNTRNITALYNWGLNLLQENKPEDGLKFFKRAYDINTKVINEKNLLLAMSSCYWIMGDIDKGIEVLNTLMEKYEYVNPSVYTTLGYFYFLKNQLKEAKKFSEKALEDDNSYAPAWDNLGQISFKEGEIEEAEKYFIKALEYKPTMVDSLYFMGEIYEGKGDLKKAYLYYKKASEAPINALNTVTKEKIIQSLANVSQNV